MAIEIRPLPELQLRAYLDAVEVAGSGELSDEQFRDVIPSFEPQRVLGAYDGEQLVGGGAIFSYQLTVPGGRSVAPPA